jgi:putative spermidine/putrescine transport system substrate-binding protein
MSEINTDMNKGVHGRYPTRRRLLEGAAALAGFTAGSGALGGFPTIWAQNIKEVV